MFTLEALESKIKNYGFAMPFWYVKKKGETKYVALNTFELKDKGSKSADEVYEQFYAEYETLGEGHYVLYLRSNPKNSSGQLELDFLVGDPPPPKTKESIGSAAPPQYAGAVGIGAILDARDREFGVRLEKANVEFEKMILERNIQDLKDLNAELNAELRRRPKTKPKTMIQGVLDMALPHLIKNFMPGQTPAPVAIAGLRTAPGQEVDIDLLNEEFEDDDADADDEAAISERFQGFVLRLAVIAGDYNAMDFTEMMLNVLEKSSKMVEKIKDLIDNQNKFTPS